MKIGLFGIGLDTYWPQFKGLKERLEGYQARIAGRLEQEETEVVNVGLVDTVDKAREAAALFKREDVALIFLYVSTYALSATVLPVVQKAKVPVIVLNLQPAAAIDYDWFNSLGDRGVMTGEWLANCQACAVPEIANVFNRTGIDFFQISGTLDDGESWLEIGEWIQSAKTADAMSQNRMGVLGHYYNGMLDIYSDLTLQAGTFGGHIQHLEMCDLKDCMDSVTGEDIRRKTSQIYEEFRVLDECPREEIARAARTAVGLDKMAARFQLGSLCYYYEGAAGEYEDIISSVIVGNSILTAHHIPVAGECEVKNVQAMKIMDLLGAGGSFTEFYGLDFNEGILLMGHDGPGHLAIAQGKPLLKPLGVYHGKPGKGLSVEMKVKHGPVTLLSVVETGNGKLKLLTAEGESVAGPILQIGNTNSRYRFPLDIKTFINNWSRQGPTHHCAIGVGHIAGKLKKLGALLKMEVVAIC